MKTAEDYRRYAAECLQAARMTMREDVRASLTAMSQRWIQLAESAERNAHLRGGNRERPPKDA